MLLPRNVSLTPIPAKALELFLQLVVDEAARVTTSRGSKKVESYHLCVPLSPSHPTQKRIHPRPALRFLTRALFSPPSRKHAIETTEMLDFLKELVEGVPDPSAGGTIPLDTPGDGEPTTSSRRKGKKAATSAGDDGDEDGGRAQPTKRRRRRKKEEVRDADSGPVDGDRDEVMHDVAPPSRQDENWEDDDNGNNGNY